MSELPSADPGTPPPPSMSDAWLEPNQPPPVHFPITRVLIDLLVSTGAAGVVTIVLEYSTVGGWESRWWEDLFGFMGFYVDGLIVWLVLVALWAALGRLPLAVGVLWSLGLVVAFANATKLTLRNEPLYPSDLDFAGDLGFLLSMVSTTSIVGVLLACLVCLGGAWWLEQRRRGRARLRDLHPHGATVLLGTRAVTMLITCCLLWQTTNFNEPDNPWRSLYELRGDHWRMSNQAANYSSNGFVGGFLYNMPVEPMAEPPGYGPEAMAAIVERQRTAAAAINTGRSGSLADVNIVFVLSESFTDPMGMRGFELDHDPIPHVRATMAQTLSGDLLSPMYGAGTANVEFEILTGQSLALFRPQVNSPYQNFVAGMDDYPSLVGWLKDQGHRTVAIHPFGGQMYKRNQVYPALGFDEFIDADGLSRASRIDDNPYLSDASAFDEAMDQIRTYDEPVFVHLVTMQNHIPVTGHYDDPLQVTGVDGDQAERLGHYARGLEHSDAAVVDLLDALAASGERTIVVYYGDHHPGIYDAEVKRATGGLGMHRVPFFIWRSWGNQPQPQPLTAPTSILPLLFEAADAPVPPYVALLEQQRRQVGILRRSDGGSRLGGPRAHDAVTGLVDDLRMVQFDLSIGQRHGAAGLWDVAPDPGSPANSPTGH
ncbi:LTA synthase family protein [Nocardioides sp. AE5]|uniref:LTA synthase family protein n=1 Tax=Nocardioides sp. AE5 TaxID=2962573 RepID=UPI002881EA50|nr:LTA synthase family protein [Nocardioides sp. AE5]MDT0200388.1 LTA synthase family protein [Nocardioides sp. AE5]